MATTLVATALTGCGSSSSSDSSTTTTSDSSSSDSSADVTTTSGEKEDVTLTVWGAEEDQELLATMVENFKTEYADVANWTINIGVESESTCKDTVLTDVEAAADVFAFADDQLNELVAAGALQACTYNADEVIEANGGSDSGAIGAASYDGTLYAYPISAGNGYFLIYNSDYLSESDVESMDTIMQVAADNGKLVAMELSNGWYLYSFFQAAGLELSLNDDGVTNTCTWNATSGTYTGADVAQAVIDIATNDGFQSLDDASIVTGIKDGSVIAAVTGSWNVTTAQEAYGDAFAAVKLPTFTLAGDQVQMSSYDGYKLMGVNAYSEYPGYAMMLAEYLTNYDNQVLRYEVRGSVPSNAEAAASDTVQADAAVAAAAVQSQYATIQRVGGNFWDPAATLGEILAQGNPDGTDLQTLLDTAVEGITAAAD